VCIIGQQSAQHHKEDGKRATEGVNDAAAAKKAKTSTLSTEQQSFVSKFNPAPAKIDKERKISTRNVKGRLNSLKKQGARFNDVKGATIAKRLQEFSGNFLSLVSGQLWCAACSSNVGSAKSAVEQHWWRCNSGNLPHFAFVLRSLLTNAPNSCPPERLFSMFNATFGEDQKSAFGDYLELAMQSQYNKRNL
jgi:hypothetical protein